MRSVTLAALMGSISLTHAAVVSQRDSVADASSAEIAGYWGSTGSEFPERSLADYCNDSEDVDIVIVSFLSMFGGNVYPNTGMSGIDDCFINEDGTTSGNCETIGQDITTCQNEGKKVFISVGGGAAQFHITGTDDAKGIASSLWNSYASPSQTTGTKRPFGNITIDGWDFDIESDPEKGNPYLVDLVNSLRGYFDSDQENTYYISGAPQCPLPVQHYGDSLTNAKYDYLWIQFYNNYCNAGAKFNGGDDEFNFAAWPGSLQGGNSSDAKLYVGLPVNAQEVNHDNAQEVVTPSEFNALYQNVSGVENFAGFMIYDLADSDAAKTNGCTYAQNLASAIKNGSPC